MSLEELWRLFPIQLSTYDRRWPSWYEHESERLHALFGQAVFRVSHIGSTSVPGLLSKPIVDVLLEVKPELSGDSVTEMLMAEGWLVMATTDQPFRVDLNKGYTTRGFAERVFHLHVVRPGDHDELYFRDVLRVDADVRSQYADLKRGLLARFEHDRDAYTNAKTGFVRSVTVAARSRFPGRYSEGGSLSSVQTF
ncbi:MAG: GrpB family protein [Propionibacteriaceae bacterium]|jgi:GrpB-like predicted nucleotidyltransferase (UPF0157 family)|nr:GrpB family protein [Propionibacteriaceae bacterium]